MALRPLTDSKAYTRFTEERDKALERILWVHLSAMDKLIGKTQDKILHLVTDARALNAFVRSSSGPIRQELELLAAQIYGIWKRLRAESYFLSHASEAEAIGRALQKRARFNIHTKRIHEKPMHDGSALHDRIQLMVDRIRRKLEDALSLSLVQGSDLDTIKWRVLRVFSSPGKRPQSARALNRAKFKERDVAITPEPWESDEAEVTTGFADEDLWQEIVEDYTSENLPPSIFKRGPTDTALYYDVTSDTEEERYAWEMEQEATEDFVRAVRGGSIDAANENGINDLQWVAILDSHTDECCRARDGRSSTEIESDLDAGKLSKDDCDAIVPPGHFNCRCRAVPMTEDMPEEPAVDYASFDDWLNEKGMAA